MKESRFNKSFIKSLVKYNKDFFTVLQEWTRVSMVKKRTS